MNEKLAIGSVTTLDVTIQVDFKGEILQYYKLQFENALDMRVRVNLEDNQTVITHQTHEGIERRARFVDIEDHRIDMTITIYVDNTSITVYDTLSEMKTMLNPISTYPILTRKGKGVFLKKIKYEKNISKKPLEIANHDDHVTNNILTEISKVITIPNFIIMIFVLNDCVQGRHARIDTYPSCANDKKTSCKNDCSDGHDPCYTHVTANKNATWATWHVSKRSSEVHLEHLTSPLEELTVTSEVNDEEKLEIVYEGVNSQDTMTVDVNWNINSEGHIMIEIDKRSKYAMVIPKHFKKLYGITVG